MKDLFLWIRDFIRLLIDLYKTDKEKNKPPVYLKEYRPNVLGTKLKR